MKVRKILRFYFSAESLDRAFNNIITANACMSGGRDGVSCAEKICRLIGEKQELGRLWRYLDGVVSSLTDGDRATLRDYAVSRTGRHGAEKLREIKRAAVKFRRHARRLDDYREGITLTGKYYCLIVGTEIL